MTGSQGDRFSVERYILFNPTSQGKYDHFHADRLLSALLTNFHPAIVQDKYPERIRGGLRTAPTDICP